jgi:hypothetical protein
MKRAIEIADLALKVLSCVAIVSAGVWALWVFVVGGATQWQNNITFDTQVLPYHDDLRLLVVHVKSKNPRPTKFELKHGSHDSYVLRVRKLPADAKAGAVFLEDQGDILTTIDLLARAGGDYEFLPGAEMDDFQAIVLPAGTTVALTADMERDMGTLDEQGKPNKDNISASTVVRIGP